MRAEVVEPETDGRVTAGEAVEEALRGGELEVDDAANNDADGGKQPRLANEVPKDVPLRRTESSTHTGFLTALTCVHQQGAEYAKCYVHRKERCDEQVTTHLTADTNAANVISESIAGCLEIADITVLCRHLSLQLLFMALQETLSIHALTQSNDNRY